MGNISLKFCNNITVVKIYRDVAAFVAGLGIFPEPYLDSILLKYIAIKFHYNQGLVSDSRSQSERVPRELF